MWRISLRSEVWIFPTRAYGAGSSSLVRRLPETCATRDPFPNGYWHLDEMVIVIRGQRYWLWRAVDNEGEVLDFLVQSKRNAQTARCAPQGSANSSAAAHLDSLEAVYEKLSRSANS